MTSPNPSQRSALMLLHYLALCAVILHLMLTILVGVYSGDQVISPALYAITDSAAVSTVLYTFVAAEYIPKIYKGSVVATLNILFAVFYFWSTVNFSFVATGVTPPASDAPELDLSWVHGRLVWFAVVSGLAACSFIGYSFILIIELLRRRGADASRYRRPALLRSASRCNPVPVNIPLIDLPRHPPPVIHHNRRLNNPYHPLRMSPSNSPSHVAV